jgi:hypothetical protein
MRSLCRALRATTNGQMHGKWRRPTAHTLEGSRHHLQNGATLSKTKGKTTSSTYLSYCCSIAWLWPKLSTEKFRVTEEKMNVRALMVLYWSSNYTVRSNVSHMSPPPLQLSLLPSPWYLESQSMWPHGPNAASTMEPELTQHNSLDRLQTRKKKKKHITVCQRLHWNRYDWNVISQQQPNVWRQQSGVVSSRQSGHTPAAVW